MAAVWSLAGIRSRRPFFTRFISRSMIPVEGGLRLSSAALIANTAEVCCYRMRLNQSSERPAEASASAAAASAKSAEISVSFFSTVSFELSVW